MEILKFSSQLKKIYDFMTKINFEWGFALAGEINQDHKISIMSPNLAGIR